MSSNPYGPVIPSRARWVSSARWLYGYPLDLDYWLDLMRKRNIGGCPSDADDMLAISKMKAFFWQCSRLGPHQLELDVAWEGGETYGFWFFGEKRALGLPNPIVLPARLPSEEQIDIVRALCNFEENPPRWHLDATVQHPESVFIGNERYTVLLLRRLSESS
jgi:hypothetical protein